MQPEDVPKVACTRCTIRVVFETIRLAKPLGNGGSKFGMTFALAGSPAQKMTPRGFYSLRHVAETMGGYYRERIDDCRLEAIAGLG